MAYKPPGTYARFVKTASPVATAGNSRIMALVGTGINYYTVSNEAITKSSTKPYDELSNNNVFEITSVSSRPIYNNLITSDNVIYTASSATNKGYRINDNIISWDSLVNATCTMDTSFCPDFAIIRGVGVTSNNIEASVDEAATIPVEDGEWMIEVSYVNEDDADLSEGEKLGCYRVINTLTGEIVGEYVASPDPATNADGSYPIPGIRLVVHDTYLVQDGEQKVFVGDYIKITTVAAKTEMEAKAYAQVATSTDGFDLKVTVKPKKVENVIKTVDLTWNDIVGDNDKYVIYVKNSEFNKEDDEYTLDDSQLTITQSETIYTLSNEDILKITGDDVKRERTFNFNITKETVMSEDEPSTVTEVKYIITNSNYDKNLKYAYKYDADYTEFTNSAEISTVDGTLANPVEIIVYSDVVDTVYQDKYITTFNQDSFVANDTIVMVAECADDFNSSTYNENTNFYFLVTTIDENENIVDSMEVNTTQSTEENEEDTPNDEETVSNVIDTSSANSGTSSPSQIALYNAISNVMVINNDTLYEDTAVYVLTYNANNNQFVITRMLDGEIDADFNNVAEDITEEMFDVIPGISFNVNINGLTDVVDGTQVYIVTSPRVTSSEIPSEGSTYYVSYKYRKSESDYEPMLFTDYDDIVATYGNYDVSASSAVLNSLSLGAEIAYNNGVSQVVCVQAKNNSDYEMQAAIDKLTKVIVGANNVNSIIPLTDSDTVGAYLKNHVDLMSSYEYGKERMGYLAGRINQPINKLATAADRSLGLTSVAEGYNDERIVYVVPGAIRKSIRDLRTGRYNERTLPGCYAAVAVAAIGLANDPAEPLTNKTIAGFTELVDLYSESEKNLLASAGCCVLEPSGTTIRIRHGITTNTDEVNSQEITLIQIKDYVIDACRTNTADLYIGRKLVASIISDIKYTIESMLNQFISQGVIINYSSLKVKRNSEEPRQIDVSFEIEAVYPLNWISIEFGFSETSF